MCLSDPLVACMHMRGCSPVASAPLFPRLRTSSMFLRRTFCPAPVSTFLVLHPPLFLVLSKMLHRNYSGEDEEGDKLSSYTSVLHEPLFILSFPLLLLHSCPFRPRSLVRLGSGWSRSSAHCKAVRLSRSLHSSQWT